MKTVAYLKTSLDRREIQEQKQTILEFTQREGITVSRFVEMPAAATKEKRIDQFFSQLASGDTLIVSELSRMGRSIGQIVRTVEALIICVCYSCEYPVFLRLWQHYLLYRTHVLYILS